MISERAERMCGSWPAPVTITSSSPTTVMFSTGLSPPARAFGTRIQVWASRQHRPSCYGESVRSSFSDWSLSGYK